MFGDYTFEISTISPRSQWVNSLGPESSGFNFKSAIFNLVYWLVSSDLLMIMSSDECHRTLLIIMAWCRQAASHYLNQCWPRSPKPYGVTRPQWVNWHIRLVSLYSLDLSSSGSALLKSQPHGNSWSVEVRGSTVCELLSCSSITRTAGSMILEKIR